MGTKNEAGAREENECDHQDTAGTVGSSGSESPIARDEPDRINYSSGARGDHQRQDFNQINPEGNLGKILSQLREIEESHLAYVEAHKKRLETRLNDAEEHERKFVSQVEAVEQQIRNLMESV